MLYKIKTITSIDELVSMEQHINIINSLSNNATIFCDLQWLINWWNLYSQVEDSLNIPVIYKHDHPVAFAPFYLKNNQTIMWIGTGGKEDAEVCPEYLDVIKIQKFEEEFAINILKSWLTNNNSKIKELFLIHCLKESIISKVLSSFKINYVTHISPTGVQHYIELAQGVAEYINTLKSSSFSKKLTKLNRLIETDESIHIKYIDNTSMEFTSYFNKLSQLHTERWERQGKPGAFTSDVFKEHHLNVYRKTRNKKKQILCVILLNNEVIGVSYCLLSKSFCHYYQSGIVDTSPHKYSPGHLLHVAMMRYCQIENIPRYDFMRGKVSGSYKDLYSATTKEMVNIQSYKSSMSTLPNVAMTIARNVKQNHKKIA